MQSNSLLSIVIPTYNRADFLDYSLEVHITQCKEHNIEVYIFDNASTDSTEEIVKKWQKKYKYIYHIKHKENIGAVANFEYALQYPSSDFVWLLGDTYQFSKDSFDRVLELIDDVNDYHIIVLNLNKKIYISSQTYTDSNNLLNELGALMTCGAVNIINRKIIENVKFERYRMTSFPHTGIIFEYLSSQQNVLVKWLQENSITSLEHPNLGKTNWSHTSKAFEIGCEDWTNFIMSLPPSYKLANKMKCIMDFGKISGLFTLKNLFMLRIANLLNYRIFSQYKSLFRLTVDYPLGLLLIISLTPRVIFKLIAVFAIVVFKREKINKIQEIMRK